ncbi:uncharacterized protein F4812DRAFT_462924 [Daldinia caldariorum]|uniref:uncharacterized protein n=1 Tax=Daldinia caldariorum TaxID=326644 RepID=UPI002007EC0A|nr:uncharacterized protein F4812DRAFT_462924 [Daldinia caldariorum]KAI1464174.1 hypothetical protein F4812DRAFT_462924 [Daldinia caldariorum]
MSKAIRALGDVLIREVLEIAKQNVNIEMGRPYVIRLCQDVYCGREAIQGESYCQTHIRKPWKVVRNEDFPREKKKKKKKKKKCGTCGDVMSPRWRYKDCQECCDRLKLKRKRESADIGSRSPTPGIGQAGYDAEDEVPPVPANGRQKAKESWKDVKMRTRLYQDPVPEAYP